MIRFLKIINTVFYGLLILFSLNACSGGGGGFPDFSCMFGCNLPPTADAGGDQNVPTGSHVFLHDSSTDPNDNITSRNWSFISTPDPSNPPNLYYSTSSSAYFIPNLDGNYIVQLMVSDYEFTSYDTAVITASQYAPIASAGPGESVPTNNTVTLDGSASYDPNLNTLTYLWSVIGIPNGSTAALSDPTAVQPTFFADVDGVYEFSLIVNDGVANSTADHIVITAANYAPVADAGGPYQGFHKQIDLDGSGSSDANNSPLSFNWSFQTVPVGSTVAFSDPTIATPSFTPDFYGLYEISLVVNDGTVDSLPDIVAINVVNHAPVADAGLSQNLHVGQVVSLDGSGSNDDDDDPLTFNWSFRSVPVGSTATFSDPLAEKPTFTPDVIGNYRVDLVVNDGFVDSDTVTIGINAVNTSPVADAGADQYADVGSQVFLDASGSFDVDGDPLLYEWSFTSLPVGSSAALSDPTAVGPFFTADLEGTYQLSLIVRDEYGYYDIDYNLKVTAPPPTTFGGTLSDVGNSVQQTADGGFIIAGTTFMGSGNGDVYLVRTDASGNLLWEKIFGGLPEERGYSVQQTNDNGFVITGSKAGDVYLIKTDASGNLLWEKTFGGTGSDAGYSVQQTSDGGYVIAGGIQIAAGNGDVYLIKTDSLGNLLWEKTFGGADNDWSYSVQQTSDGGYIISGHTSYHAIYLIKTDASGDLVWEKSFISGKQGRSVQQTSDGGYIVAGYGGGAIDFYLLKTDSLGNLIWDKLISGTNVGYSVQQTSDGGYVIVGYTAIPNSGKGYDICLARTDSLGNVISKRSFGGTGEERGYSVQQTTDGEFIIVGETKSYGAGYSDVYLIKTDGVSTTW